ncbi:protein JASON-like isoform X2 [Populus alba x Populus x berolinensis]|nr:protein JASON-like isoform X2 [Populus alba x Populus x berolinensis]
MGCFFTCLRTKEDRSNRSRPHAISSDSLRCEPTLEAGVSKNRLSSLFLAEEKEESLRGDVDNPCLGSSHINKGLRDEAKFLKACGTLTETPIEIRKACEKFNGSPALDKDSEPSKFHSWLPSTSIKKLQLDNQTVQPLTPVKLCEGWGKDSVSSEQTPSSSCITNVHASEDSESGSRERVIKVQANENDDVVAGPPWLSTSIVQNRNKSVRFECDFDTSSSKGSSSENSCQVPGKYESPGNLSVSKPSPKPTPLKLLDDMQTPGTVFPANLETSGNDGKTRIRSQHVYSVLNPVESASQWKLSKEDDFNSLRLSGEPRESLEQSESATPKPERGVKESSSGKDLKVEASLSSWFKPLQSTLGEDNPNTGTASSKKFRFGRTPGDRPIIGMVAAHWNENEPSQISPKWWDGNGIPNSTNKYKEDQKVSWHATPFEERLEKALSEESVISQRKPISGGPIVFDECEESDTALSRLQTSTQAKSVVSF